MANEDNKNSNNNTQQQNTTNNPTPQKQSDADSLRPGLRSVTNSVDRKKFPEVGKKKLEG